MWVNNRRGWWRCRWGCHDSTIGRCTSLVRTTTLISSCIYTKCIQCEQINLKKYIYIFIQKKKKNWKRTTNNHIEFRTSGRRRSRSSERSDITVGSPPIDHRVWFSASPPCRFRVTKCHLFDMKINFNAGPREYNTGNWKGINEYLRIRIP